MFNDHESEIGTTDNEDALRSNQVLARLREDLEKVGFDVESGKKKEDKIQRPVFFGEDGNPTVRYEIDAFHPDWNCGLEVEAGRGWMENAVYRDRILASVMVDVDYFILAVANEYTYQSGGQTTNSHDYRNARKLAATIGVAPQSWAGLYATVTQFSEVERHSSTYPSGVRFPREL